MRRYFLSFFMLTATAFGIAQDQKGPSASSYEFGQENKVKISSASLTKIDNQPAVMVVMPYAPSEVLSAMTEYEIDCYRSKKKQSTAFVAFDNTAIMKKNTKDASLIFRVGPADVQRPDQSVVYLLLNSPIDKGDDAGTVYQFDSKDAIEYLNNLSVAVQAITLDQQIKTYTANLKKEEKQEEKCTKRCDRLSDKKTSNEEKVAQNKPSAVKKDQKLELRLTESQSELALHKTTAEKHRADLILLSNQKKSFYK